MDGETQVARLEGEVAALRAELAQLRAAHRVDREHEQLRHRDYVVGLLAETETAVERNQHLVRRARRLRARLDAAERSVEEAARREQDLRAELAAVRASRAWRAGSTLRRVVGGRRP